MLCKSSYIALILLLGLYYNSVPIAWLSYSTFAESAFASHCVNPDKASCQGKCQVMSMTDKAEKSNKSQMPTFQFAQIQPSLLSSMSIPDLSRIGEKLVFFIEIASIRKGIPISPFHPPKITAWAFVL